MISDTPEILLSDKSDNVKNCDENNNGLITLSKNTNEKLYNFLIDEINKYKLTIEDKENIIHTLTNKNQELLTQLEDCQNKLNKITNVNLLIKLKENLTNKKNEFETEINNINEKNENETLLKSPVVVVEKVDKVDKQPINKKRPSVLRRGF
jgi:hypothetical protein